MYTDLKDFGPINPEYKDSSKVSDPAKYPEKNPSTLIISILLNFPFLK
jgi:hypothetical protein